MDRLFGKGGGRGVKRGRWKFQPWVDRGVALESRVLMSHGTTTFAAAPLSFTEPRQSIGVRVRYGGKVMEVTDSDRERYAFVVSGPGVIRVLPAPGGKARVILDGTTTRSELTIDPVRPVPEGNRAHQFSLGMTKRDGRINVAGIEVTSGQIGSILGYRTTVLSGPIVSMGETPIERIALLSIESGASIRSGGDINTLDVLNGATFSGTGTGLVVGRDLNWFNTGLSVAFTNGANFLVGRDVGLAAQPSKGTGPSGQGILIKGNLTIGVGSTFVVQRRNYGILVQGEVVGANRISIGSGADNFIALGGFVDN